MTPRAVTAAFLFAVLACSAAVATEVETADEGAVRVEVTPATRIAAAVVWPPASRIGDALSTRPLRVALRAALESARTGLGDAADILVTEGSMLAAGFETGLADEAVLIAALATVARPGEITDEAIERAIRAEATGSPRSPLDVARETVLRRIAGQAHPDPRPTVSFEEVRDLAGRLSTEPVRVVATGRSGLAGRIAARLADRLAPADTRAGDLPPVVGRGVIVPRPTDSTVLVVGYRADASLAAELGAAVPLIAEVLRDGPGSLRQRLEVAIDAPIVLRVDLEPIGGAGEGALLIQVGVPADRAERAFDVLVGAVASLGALAPRQAALVEARGRLDAAAAALQGAASRRVRQLLLPDSWRWPPEDRWSRPLGPDDFATAVRRLLVRERSAIAVSGRVPRGLTERAPFAGPAPGGQGTPTSDASDLLGRVARSVAPGGLHGADRGFASRYAVSERTPAGLARSALAIRSRDGEVSVTLEIDGREHRDPPPGAAARSGFERRVALAMRQPAILIAFAESGIAVVDEIDVECGDSTCAALLAELDDGTRLELVVDEESGRPVELRTRWCCADPDEAPDETIRFVEWVENDGIRLASRLETVGSTGSTRSIELVEWRWEENDPGTDPR